MRESIEKFNTKRFNSINFIIIIIIIIIFIIIIIIFIIIILLYIFGMVITITKQPKYIMYDHRVYKLKVYKNNIERA